MTTNPLEPLGEFLWTRLEGAAASVRRRSLVRLLLACRGERRGSLAWQRGVAVEGVVRHCGMFIVLYDPVYALYKYERRHTGKCEYLLIYIYVYM